MNLSINHLNGYSTLMSSDMWLIIIFQRSIVTEKKKIRGNCLKLNTNSKILFLLRITS